MPVAAKSTDFVISRVFDAPRELVWKAFTDPEHMKEWWGPKDTPVVVSNTDLRVGGSYHGAMRAPNGSLMWAKFVYREIDPPRRLVWVHSFSDEAGGLTRHPMSPTWPLQMLTTVTFGDLPNGKTEVTLRWSPLDASEDELRTFDAARDSMHGGWGGSFDRLATHLGRSP